jgi:hypothetical protein
MKWGNIRAILMPSVISYGDDRYEPQIRLILRIWGYPVRSEDEAALAASIVDL